MKGIPLSDILALAVGLIGLLTAWVRRTNRLPKSVQNYIAELGGLDRLTELCATVAAFGDLTNDERKAKVALMLQDIAIAKIGFRLPDSIANLVVEYAYTTYRRQIGK
jgi:hypothetical protein